MKELIEQEAEKRYPDGIMNGNMIEPGCKDQFHAGASWMASLYSCTPDEVKEMRELLSDWLNDIKHPLSPYKSAPYNMAKTIDRIEKLLNEK